MAMSGSHQVFTRCSLGHLQASKGIEILGVWRSAPLAGAAGGR